MHEYVKSTIGYVFGVLFESKTCEIARLYPDGQCKMDSWVCLWIPKVNIVPTQKCILGSTRLSFVYLREPLGGGVHPKMDHPKVYLTEVHLWMGVKSIAITTTWQTPLTQIPAKSAKTLPRPLFGYETLLT